MPSTPPLEQLLPPGDVAGGAAEATILQAEATLGVRFSPSYPSFLAQFGAACCKGFELGGLFHHPDKTAWLSSMSGKARVLTEAEWKYSLHPATPALFPDTRTHWRHVVMWTLQNRRLSRGHIEPRYLAISSDGGVYTFYLDTGGPEPVSPVVALGPELDYALLATDFNAFVIACYNGTLPWFVTANATPSDIERGLC